ncbi:MAG: TonB-dependent receptor plug domain-containing protein [Chitinophagales bacterium]
MKKILFMALIVMYSSYSYAQELSIFDKNTKEALAFASVHSKDLNLTVLSNNEGKVDLSTLSSAKHINISYLGYASKHFTYAELKALGFVIGLQKLDMDLNEVVVSATKWKESSAKIPTKVVNIDRKELAIQNPQTAADLLGVSGKVFIQKSQQGGGSPMIRGFATNRLLYSVDGVRMNTAIFRAGNIQNVINLDPLAMQDVEVLFGPGSVMYGSDAIGGVMQFTTLVPTLSDSDQVLVKGNALARYASANTGKTAHFDVNVGWKKFAMLTSMSYSDYDHLRQGSKGPEEYLKPFYVSRIDSTDVVVSQEDPLLQVPTAYSQINLMQKLKYQANSNLSFDYAFHYSSTSSYGRYDRHNRMRNDLPRYAVWDYGPQKWMMNQFAINYNKETKIFDKAIFNVAHQLFEESRIDRSLNKDEQNTQVEKVNAYSLNLDFYKKIKSSHSFSYGVEYVYNKVKSTGELEDISTNLVELGPARYPQSSWQSIGFT